MNTDKPSREVMSPEGVEERLISQVAFRITLTGGGKFRVYVRDMEKGAHDAGCYNTYEEAQQIVSVIMATAALVGANPGKSPAELMAYIRSTPNDKDKPK